MWNELMARMREDWSSKLSPEEGRRITLEGWGIIAIGTLIIVLFGDGRTDERLFVTVLVFGAFCGISNLKRRRNQHRVSFWLFVAGLAIALGIAVAKVEIRPVQGPSLPYATPIVFGVGALVWVLINVYEVLVARGEQK
jgi:hypothetical protein